MADFAAALAALRAARPEAKTPAADEGNEPAPAALEPVAGTMASPVAELPETPEIPSEPDAAAMYDPTDSGSDIDLDEILDYLDHEAGVEAAPEPEPELESVLDAAPEEAIPVAAADHDTAVTAVKPIEQEWEELYEPALPGRTELAAVVAAIETELPAGQLDESAAGTDRAAAVHRHLVFGIDSDKFAVNLDNLLEIDNMPAWTGIPGLPPTVRGLINLRGEIVSLLELRAILGLPHPEGARKGKIFVAATADRQTVSAFAVDEIEGIYGFDQARVAPVPALVASSATKAITGVVEHDGRLVRILDIAAVLSDVEKTFSVDQMWM